MAEPKLGYLIDRIIRCVMGAGFVWVCFIEPILTS